METNTSIGNGSGQERQQKSEKADPAREPVITLVIKRGGVELTTMKLDFKDQDLARASQSRGGPAVSASEGQMAARSTDSQGSSAAPVSGSKDLVITIDQRTENGASKDPSAAPVSGSKDLVITIEV